MTYTVTFTTSARKQLAAISEPHRSRILRALAGLANDPHPAGSRKLVGRVEQWQIRVSDYRAVYTIEDAQLVVTVIRVGHRSSVYDELPRHAASRRAGGSPAENAPGIAELLAIVRGDRQGSRRRGARLNVYTETSALLASPVRLSLRHDPAHARSRIRDLAHCDEEDEVMNDSQREELPPVNPDDTRIGVAESAFDRAWRSAERLFAHATVR